MRLALTIFGLLSLACQIVAQPPGGGGSGDGPPAADPGNTNQSNPNPQPPNPTGPPPGDVTGGNGTTALPSRVNGTVAFSGLNAALYATRFLVVTVRNNNATAQPYTLTVTAPDHVTIKRYNGTATRNGQVLTYRDQTVAGASSRSYNITYRQNSRREPFTQTWRAVVAFANGTTVTGTFVQPVEEQAIDPEVLLYILTPALVREGKSYYAKVLLRNNICEGDDDVGGYDDYGSASRNKLMKQLKKAGHKDDDDNEHTIRNIHVRIELPRGVDVDGVPSNVRRNGRILTFTVDELQQSETYDFKLKTGDQNGLESQTWTGRALWNGNPPRSRAVASATTRIVPKDDGTRDTYFRQPEDPDPAC